MNKDSNARQRTHRQQTRLYSRLVLSGKNRLGNLQAKVE